mmetsp:Transcript_67255/g.152041  ORF Transcript_67255/g.152041 Transcript_67255/m.152041 type:complete len:301 (+) Transcript_67255:2772-3674(+)
MPRLQGLRQRRHGQCACRAGVSADLAARAVHRRSLNAEVEARVRVATRGLPSVEACRPCGKFPSRDEERPDHRVGADGTADITLDALVHVNYGDGLGHTALGIGRLPRLNAPICLELADLEFPSFANLDTVKNFLHIRRRSLVPVFFVAILGCTCNRPTRCIVGDLPELSQSSIHRLDILVDHVVPLAFVCLLDCILEKAQSLLNWKDPRKLEEDGRHDVVDELAHSCLFGHAGSIDGEHLHLLLSNHSAKGVWQLRLQLCVRPGHVKHQGTTLHAAFKNDACFDGKDVLLLVHCQVTTT